VCGRVPRSLDALSAEVFLGGERVVGVTAQRQIVLGVLAASREGSKMMELEQVGLRAAASRAVGVGATALVALIDGTSHSSGNVPAALARLVGLDLAVLVGLGNVPAALARVVGVELSARLGLGVVFAPAGVLGLDLGAPLVRGVRWRRS
jgi:hypothetical protein